MPQGLVRNRLACNSSTFVLHSQNKRGCPVPEPPQTQRLHSALKIDCSIFCSLLMQLVVLHHWRSAQPQPKPTTRHRTIIAFHCYLLSRQNRAVQKRDLQQNRKSVV